MAGQYDESAKNTMLEALRSSIDEVSLHESDPGTGDSNEISGGDYARKSVSFDAPSGGEMSISNEPVFDIPGGSTVAWVAFWAGLERKAKAPLTEETFSNDGTYTLTSATTLSIEDAD